MVLKFIVPYNLWPSCEISFWLNSRLIVQGTIAYFYTMNRLIECTAILCVSFKTVHMKFIYIVSTGRKLLGKALENQ